MMSKKHIYKCNNLITLNKIYQHLNPYPEQPCKIADLNDCAPFDGYSLASSLQGTVISYSLYDAAGRACEMMSRVDSATVDIAV